MSGTIGKQWFKSQQRKVYNVKHQKGNASEKEWPHERCKLLDTTIITVLEENKAMWIRALPAETERSKC